MLMSEMSVMTDREAIKLLGELVTAVQWETEEGGENRCAFYYPSTGDTVPFRNADHTGKAVLYPGLIGRIRIRNRTAALWVEYKGKCNEHPCVFARDGVFNTSILRQRVVQMMNLEIEKEKHGLA